MYARLALNLIKGNPLPPSLQCYTTNLDLWHPKFLQPVQWTPKLFFTWSQIMSNVPFLKTPAHGETSYICL